MMEAHNCTWAGNEAAEVASIHSGHGRTSSSPARIFLARTLPVRTSPAHTGGRHRNDEARAQLGGSVWKNASISRRNCLGQAPAARKGCFEGGLVVVGWVVSAAAEVLPVSSSEHAQKEGMIEVSRGPGTGYMVFDATVGSRRRWATHMGWSSACRHL